MVERGGTTHAHFHSSTLPTQVALNLQLRINDKEDQLSFMYSEMKLTKVYKR